MPSEISFQDIVNQQSKAQCSECLRLFDLFDEEEASEFYYGHDCEAQ